MKIGIFDSGIGGISVLHEALHLLPGETFMFYADVDHVPYGTRSPAEICGFADEITAFLLNRGADVILIACNTATSVAAEMLRKKYTVPIIGMEPAVKPAVKLNRRGGNPAGRVLVMATPVTIREHKLQNLIRTVDTAHDTDLLAMPELVTFAETGRFDGPEVRQYLQERVQTLPAPAAAYHAVVLGCTHFNYFKALYPAVFPGDTALIDGNAGTVRHLADVMGVAVAERDSREYNWQELEQKVEYFYSGRRVTDPAELQKLRRLHEKLEEVRSL